MSDQMIVFKRRMALVGAEIASKLEHKKSEKDRKDVKERVHAEDLMLDVGKYGGYWASEKDMDAWLKECTNEAEKSKMVEAQIKFRKCVLHCENVNNCLNLELQTWIW